ncbi:MAG: N-acetyltransferase [Planctomycetes bacterium]|nr:N-acetyltransferase [Planctomycetota bacterium]
MEIRKARLQDVKGIHSLVAEFASKDAMLPLSIGDIYERLRDFFVIDDAEGRIIACGAIHVTWESLVELRSLAVSASAQKQNLGRKLMDELIAEAKRLGAGEVFTLTYIPDFFKKFGFEIIDRHDLPHKVWLDCTKCPKFPDCGEIAMKRKVDNG